jgi:hypothetical protein
MTLVILCVGREDQIKFKHIFLSFIVPVHVHPPVYLCAMQQEELLEPSY